MLLLSKNQSGVTLQVKVIITYPGNSKKNTNIHVLHICKICNFLHVENILLNLPAQQVIV